MKQTNKEEKAMSKSISIHYRRNFYLRYSQADAISPQVVAKLEDKRNIAYSSACGNIGSENLPQAGASLQQILFAIPWGHLRLIIDKCQNDSDHAYHRRNREQIMSYIRWESGRKSLDEAT